MCGVCVCKEQVFMDIFGDLRKQLYSCKCQTYYLIKIYAHVHDKFIRLFYESVFSYDDSLYVTVNACAK